LILAALAAPGNAQQSDVPRFRLFIGERRSIAFEARISSSLVVEPDVARAAYTGDVVEIEGRDFGETLVIVGTTVGRSMFIVEVVGHPVATAADVTRINRRLPPPKTLAQSLLAGTGFYTVTFAPPTRPAPAALIQQFSYRAQLGSARAFTLSGNRTSFIGGSASGIESAAHGFDELTATLQTASGSLTLLDARLDILPHAIYGYPVRGAHYRSSNSSPLGGAEVFAGSARSGINSWRDGGGFLTGALLPLHTSKTLRLRSGLLAVHSPNSRPSGLSPGGGLSLIWHGDLSYEPDARTSIGAAVEAARGQLSWDARLRLRRGVFDLNAESSRVGDRSPYINLGAVASGHSSYAAAVGWQPSEMFSAQARYQQTSADHPSPFPRFRLISVGAYAKLAGGFQFGGRAGNTRTRICDSSFGTCLESETSNADATVTLARARWNFQTDASLWAQKFGSIGFRIGHGHQVRNEARFNWPRVSATAFLDFTKTAYTQTSALLQNPAPLPPALRRLFLADPLRFLLNHGEAISTALDGLPLPQTAGLSAGTRLHWQHARGQLNGEVRYMEQAYNADARARSLLSTMDASARLNGATSAGIKITRVLSGSSDYTQVTFSLTRFFNAESSDLSRLAGLAGITRSRIAGRVFYDGNGNGADDQGERGFVGVVVTLAETGQRAVTDAQGRYSFSVRGAGSYTVSLEPRIFFGGLVRATTTNSVSLVIASRDKATASFGLTDETSLSGRVVNDANDSGIAGVLLRLRRAEHRDVVVAEATTDGGGGYYFAHLAPGSYMIEVDAATIPPEHTLARPGEIAVRLAPLRPAQLDLPISAERAITGVVYFDRDGDARYSDAVDAAATGARVVASCAGREFAAESDARGRYMLRGLPAGVVTLSAVLLDGRKTRTLFVSLDAVPSLLRGVNMKVE
jgi:hypothetical protein